MTNEERREALNRARRNALQWAEWAERNFGSALSNDSIRIRTDMATMWAAVADAMKDGDPIHDGPDGTPVKASTFPTPEGVIIR